MNELQRAALLSTKTIEGEKKKYQAAPKHRVQHRTINTRDDSLVHIVADVGNTGLSVRLEC